MTLTPEESFLWRCARLWRTPRRIVKAGEGPAGLDWQRVVAVGRANKMDTLLLGVLSETGWLAQLPLAARESLQQGTARLATNAANFGDVLRVYLRRAAERRLETVVLKGLSVSLNVYGDPAMRPGGDVDLLVRKRDAYASLALLEDEMDAVPYYRQLDDRYYERHHLHHQRGWHDTRLWFEVHWALDHPYTLLTIDYDAVIDRAAPGRLLGEPVHDLSLPDLLLSLAIHLVKHAIYLPSVGARPDLPRIILADGMLMYFVDVAELVKRFHAEIDWPLVVRLARQWGAVPILGSVLRVCHDLLDAPVPPPVLAELPIGRSWPIIERAMNGMADHEIGIYQGQRPNRLWSFLVGYNDSIIFRPIRLLDMAVYSLPPASFLRRRYGSSSPVVRATHFLRALGQHGRSAIDTAYYTLKVQWRLRAGRQRASSAKLQVASDK